MQRILKLALGLYLAGSAIAYGAGSFRGGMSGGGFRGGIRAGGFRGGIGIGGYRGGIGIRGYRGGAHFGGRHQFSAFYPSGFRRAHFGYGGFGFRHHSAYPLVWPVGYGGWFPYSAPEYAPAGYAYAAPAPQVIVIAPLAPQTFSEPAPAPARPETREEYGPAGPEARERPVSPQQVYFLVPFKDKTVQAAVAYWLENATLHYITIAGAHRSAPVSDVDRDAAVKLNRSRPIQLRLPPPKR